MSPVGQASILLWLLVTGLAGCATPPPTASEAPPGASPRPTSPRATFVLLPDADGSVGRIEIHTPQGSHTLSAPREATTVAAPGAVPSAPVTLSEEEVARVFGPALTALPPTPLHFTLYFSAGSLELTPQSRELIPLVIAAISDRRSVDTTLVGHSDTMGTKSYNYDLGRRRAAMVARLLEQGGVPPSSLEVLSRGEDELAVPTPDNVAEPRNRRVEVTIR